MKGNSTTISLIIALVVVVILIGPGVKRLYDSRDNFFGTLPPVFEYTEEDFATPQLYNIPLKYYSASLAYQPSVDECIFPLKGFNDLFTYYSIDIVSSEDGKRLWLKDSTGQTVDPLIILPDINLCVSEGIGDIQPTDFVKLRKKDPFIQKDYFDVSITGKEFKVDRKYVEEEPALYFKKVDDKYNTCIVITERKKFDSLPLCKDFSARQSMDLFKDSIEKCAAIEQNNCVCGLDVNLAKTAVMEMTATPSNSNITITKGTEIISEEFELFFNLGINTVNTPREDSATNVFDDPGELSGLIKLYPNLNSFTITSDEWNNLIKSDIQNMRFKGSVYVLKQNPFSDTSFVAIKGDDGVFTTHFFKPNTINRYLFLDESDINKYPYCSKQ